MSTVKGSKYIQGTCSCGHVGKQLRPDICGYCDKKSKKIRPRTEEKRWLDARICTVRRRFMALPPESQRDLMQEFLQIIVDKKSEDTSNQMVCWID